MTGPCPCAECVLAGCDRPPVTLSLWSYADQRYKLRELHGKELARHYREKDARKEMIRKMGEALMAKARSTK